MTMNSIRYTVLTMAKNRPKDWRKGQAVFNYANQLHPEIAQKYINTNIDPFYNDDNIDDFLYAMAKDLGETTTSVDAQKKNDIKVFKKFLKDFLHEGQIDGVKFIYDIDHQSIGDLLNAIDEYFNK